MNVIPHLTAWGVGGAVLLGVTVLLRRRRRAAVDLGLGVVWGLWWVEVGVTVLLAGALAPTEDRSRSPWEPVSFGLPEVDALYVPSTTLAIDGRHPVRTPGTWRIVLVGDSFTAGQGVGPDETLGAALLRALDGRTGTLRPEVINLGIPGLGTHELLAVAADEALAWSPDVVVWVHVLNDLPSAQPLARLPGLGRQVDDGIVDRTNDARDPGPWWTAALVQRLVERQRVASAVEQVYRDGHDPALAGAELTGFRSGLTPIVAEQTARGGRFVLATYPLLHRLDAYPFTDAHGTVLDLARAAGAEPVDLLPPFLGRDESTLWASRTDHHPNAEGHTLAAQALAEALLAGPVAPAGPRGCMPLDAARAAVDAAADPVAKLAAARQLRCVDPGSPLGPLAQAEARVAIPPEALPQPFHRGTMAALAVKQTAALARTRPEELAPGRLVEVARQAKGLD